jgi:hypothetical protein
MSVELEAGAWLHRSESRLERNGSRVVTHYRRRILTADGKRFCLSGIERCETATGETPCDWAPYGGLLGRATELSAERLHALLSTQGWRSQANR